jgi:hypothetical protein
MKLRLHISDSIVKFVEEVPEATPSLPDSMSEGKRVTDYLMALRKHLDTVLEDQLPSEVATGIPKEYILTVPGEWPHHIHNEFLRFAEAAGMGLNENIHTIAETEAVALNVLEELRAWTEPRYTIGDTFVICNVGSG